MELTGKNICVLDLETAKSAEDCRYCGRDRAQHHNLTCDFAAGTPPVWHCGDGGHTTYAPLGWNDPVALGLSIGCYYSYADSRMHWFDTPMLAATVRGFVNTQPLLVSFNGIAFDFALMRGLLRQRADEMLDEHLPDDPDERPGSALARTKSHSAALMGVCNAFEALCATSYDILAEIWKVDPDRKFERGLNSLDALSQANGFGAKEMDGATAPRLWAQGRYVEVLTYCQGDVLRTKKLFEMICEGRPFLRGDRRPLTLLAPPVPSGAPAEGNEP